MQTRINIAKVLPEGYNALLGVEKFLAGSVLTPTHRELIKIRASQINGCAFCIDMHTTEALKNGETPKRIFLLDAWREADLYTAEEQAILALTEEITNIQGHVSDETYVRAAQLFDEKYLAAVIMMAFTINSWNRLAISTGMRAV